MTTTSVATNMATNVATPLRSDRAVERMPEPDAPASTRPASVLDQILDHQAAVDLGRKLVPTGYLPEHIKTPEQAMAIILTGQEMGMRPMRALRSLVMVKGKVTENADSQLARFKADGGRARWLVLNETEAKLWLRHPNGDEHVETFTMADADRAGLTRPSRNGEPSMFVKFPKAMLRSRAITAGLKSIGWEGGVGAYDPDELVQVPTWDEPDTVAASASPGRPSQSGAVEGGPAVSSGRPGDSFARMTLEQAQAMPFPFQRGKPQHGRPLGELDNDFLVSVGSWIREKQDERDDDAFHADTLHAIGLILADREKQQTVLPLDGGGNGDAGSAGETASHDVVFPSLTKFPGLAGKKLSQISTAILEEVRPALTDAAHEALALAIGDVLDARRMDDEKSGLPF